MAILADVVKTKQTRVLVHCMTGTTRYGLILNTRLKLSVHFPCGYSQTYEELKSTWIMVVANNAGIQPFFGLQLERSASCEQEL